MLNKTNLILISVCISLAILLTFSLTKLFNIMAINKVIDGICIVAEKV